MSQIIILSFGYLHGEPPEAAHVVWDLRWHYRDPHVSPALRNLTAHDPEVVNAVFGTAGIAPLIEAMAASAKAYMSGPAAYNNDLVYAIGCAGGRHRAPVVAVKLRDVLTLDGHDVTLMHRDLDKAVVERGHTTDPRPRHCLYQCAHHHGAGPKDHTLECVLPSPMAENAYVCDTCRADITRQEIAADPYNRGDNYAMFGDDE